MRIKNFILVLSAMLLGLSMSLNQVFAKPLIDLGPVIDGFIKELEQLLLTVKGAVMGLGKVLGGTILIIGLVLWASDLFSYKGRRLITAGALLLLILELLS
ncbi:MAG: hypothetical protein DRO00_01005 [Thermoproteota archaeon]|nr:MAG: hypothetical protein DRO00_01005 [Candidatus Korarchaeota archaeon]